MTDTERILGGADGLRAVLEEVRLPFELPGAEAARAERAGIADQLDDYVLPRLRDIDAPALAVVGGSTGSGKSTLVNSLVGATVSRPGVLRPTTVAPVLVHHPSAARWFADDRVLPGLARVTGGEAQGHGEIGLVATAALPEALALVDAPDIDSIVDENRALATQLLDAADLWVFVTTAARYADAVPWELLDRAVRRGVEVALVLNRVPRGAGAEVASHLGEMLETHGLGQAPVFVLEEQALDDGRLPVGEVAPVRRWIEELAVDQEARTEMIRRTVVTTVLDVSRRADGVAAAVSEQEAAVDHLRTSVREHFADAQRRLADDVRDGTVMRGEVLARWQDLVGTGDLLRMLQSGIGRWRDKITSALTGRPSPADRFEGAIESGVQTLVRARIAEAVERTAAEWRAHPAGEAVLREADDDLRRPSVELDERSGRMVREWQGALLDLLRQEGTAKRSTAKVLSYGINGAALVLMVTVFAHTGGLTGGEVAIAGGSSAAGQKLLEALIGDQAVRRLAASARDDLHARTADLVEHEASRFRAALDVLHLEPGGADRLRSAAAALRSEASR
jgi:energy-coupling factor transporter ATP-binding protein EcfA2